MYSAILVAIDCTSCPTAPRSFFSPLVCLLVTAAILDVASSRPRARGPAGLAALAACFDLMHRAVLPCLFACCATCSWSLPVGLLRSHLASSLSALSRACHFLCPVRPSSARPPRLPLARLSCFPSYACLAPAPP